MKLIILNLLLFLSLSGCITYDSSKRPLRVFNNSDSAIYVSYNSSDSLSINPELKLFEKRGGDVIAANGVKLCSIVSPDYRINAYDNSNLRPAAYSNKDKWIPYKEKNSVTFFFIKESVMRTHTWTEIYLGQLYVKKVNYTYSKLEELDYEITYEP